MNIKTIAEFVEDEETLEAIRRVGVDYAQGYHIAKPAPIEIALYNKPIDLSLESAQVELIHMQAAAIKH
jgi:EAL domain-containing protein (putative c-di-GMP-specific phosphodiesterase class I)